MSCCRAVSRRPKVCNANAKGGLLQKRRGKRPIRKETCFFDEGITINFRHFFMASCLRCGQPRTPAALPWPHCNDIWGQKCVGYACECEASYNLKLPRGLAPDWSGKGPNYRMPMRSVLPEHCSIMACVPYTIVYHDGDYVDPEAKTRIFQECERKGDHRFVTVEAKFQETRFQVAG